MEQTVTYRKVPLWQVILGQLKNGAQMAFYVLINMIAYLGSGRYGIDTILVGTILTSAVSATASSTPSWQWPSTASTPNTERSATC